MNKKNFGACSQWIIIQIRSAGNLQNPQEAVIISTNICFLTNFTELQCTDQLLVHGTKCIVAPTIFFLGGGLAHVALAAAPPYTVFSVVHLNYCESLYNNRTM